LSVKGYNSRKGHLLKEHAATLLTITGGLFTAILAALFAVFLGDVPGWAVGCAFIISFTAGSVTGFLFGRYCYPTTAPRRMKKGEATDGFVEADTISPSQGSNAIERRPSNTEPYGMNVTQESLYRFYTMYEVEHFSVTWECWTDGIENLIGVDAPPLCARCKTPLEDEDEKKWSCPNNNCGATYSKPPVGINPAMQVSKIFIGKVKRKEINPQDAKRTGSETISQY
jgi:hypothetical protein